MLVGRARFELATNGLKEVAALQNHINQWSTRLKNDCSIECAIAYRLLNFVFLQLT